MSDLVNKVHASFKKRFGAPSITIAAPGRVNLIGEHTDYNQGFVLPAAIDKHIVLAMKRNNRDVIRLHSIDMDESVEVSTGLVFQPNQGTWPDYLIGVVDELQKNTDISDAIIPGFDCVFCGDIPIGAGLSSSAALESGVAFGLNELFFLHLHRTKMARIAQKAENNFVGVQCGIMDQFASFHGKEGSVIKLDCRSLSFDRYPFVSNDISVLLCDSMVRRELAGSEYNKRRQQCEEGVDVIRHTHPDVDSLRDVTCEQLEAHRDKMTPVVFKRCRYVLEENERLDKACQALLNNDLGLFGEKMNASHVGLRDDYEVSCRELDFLVEAALDGAGVLGARMMGGGFGGCTINLVDNTHLDDIKDRITTDYVQKTGIKPAFHVASIGNGTRLV